MKEEREEMKATGFLHTYLHPDLLSKTASTILTSLYLHLLVQDKLILIHKLILNLAN